MVKSDNQILQEILTEVKDTRIGIRALDSIVRECETDISGLQMSASHFNKHIAEAEEARKQRNSTELRLALLEQLFNEFMKREQARDGKEEKLIYANQLRDQKLQDDRRDAKRMFWYFSIAQIVTLAIAIYK